MYLGNKPYYLKEEEISNIEKIISNMSLDEKIGQLFIPIGFSSDKNYLDYLLSKHIGGIFFRPGYFSEVKETYEYLQSHSSIPLLTTANLEDGGTGAFFEGTSFGKPMAIAATDNIDYAYQLGKICALEAAKVGVNWSFSPIVDVDYNFRNPITNVRTFGDNPEKIISMSKEYIRAFNEQNFLTSIKHFPGDGVDERDQHILTSINSLPYDAWKKTYGKVYQDLIDFGVKAIMVGHIAFPDFTGNDMPATLSEKILKELLRGNLEFNGLIITDASPMVGFSALKREEAVPLSIEYGCDMFLFYKDFEEDLMYMKKGVEKGLLSKERLDDAVRRILATKMSMGLFENKEKLESREEDFSSVVEKLAKDSITLVREEKGVLPLDSKKYKRLLIEILGDSDSNEMVRQTILQEFKNRDFDVTFYEPEVNILELESIEKFKSKYDAVIYFANIQNMSNKTTARINWHTLYGLGNNVPWFTKEVPTVMISLGNPYHLFDAPMIQTYINCYCNYEHFIKSSVRKLCGEEQFYGRSPINPFCKNVLLEELMNGN